LQFVRLQLAGVGLTCSAERTTLAGRDVRDIATSGLIWRGCGEILVQQVRCHWQVVLRIGRRLELALLPATQSKLFDFQGACIDEEHRPNTAFGLE
jgi:hypothetical protein